MPVRAPSYGLQAPLLALRVNPMVDAKAPLLAYEKAAERQRASNLRNLRKQVGAQMGAGDYLGASQSAMAGGDIQTGMLLQADQRKRAAEIHNRLADVSKRIGDDPQKRAAFAATLKRYNIDPATMPIGPTHEEKLNLEYRQALIDKAKRPAEMPAAVRTYEYLQGLPPEERKEFIATKAAGAPTTNVYTGDIPLTKTATTNVQKKMMDAYSRLRRIGQQRATYRPKWQDIPTRGKMWGLDLKAKFTKLNPKNRKDLIDYSTFRSTAFEDMNQVLADLSGAAVSEQEYRRQLKVLPNPGTGLFDGDSPPVYEAKMNRLHRESRMAVARYNYWLKHGLPNDPSSKPWDMGHLGPSDPGSGSDSMEAVIDREAKKVVAAIREKNPTMPNENVRQLAKRRLSKLFGVQFDKGT